MTPTMANREELLKWWNKFTTNDERKKAPFYKGHGISHIIAKRDWEGEHIKEFKGQKGLDVALKLVEVIAKGTTGTTKEGKKNVTKDGYIAIFDKDTDASSLTDILPTGQEYWVLSGFKIATQPYELLDELVLQSVDGHGGVDDPLRPLAECDNALHHATELHPSVFTGLHFIPDSQKRKGTFDILKPRTATNISSLKGNPQPTGAHRKNDEGGTAPTHSALTLHPREVGATDPKPEDSITESVWPVKRWEPPKFGTAAYGFSWDL
ncbi:MAG: hypothetical protein IJU37_04525 [Desulfovibrio sp.]|nr:hypothetical protein [Desulfovibrio sp.]